MEFNDTIFTDAKEVPMRDILHKTTAILQGRGKLISLREHTEEKETISDVRKNFIYIASEAETQEEPTTPRVHIKKSFDSVSRDERFAFRVKGYFYVNHARRVVRIDYCHTLRINLHWKSKTSSPKKTVTMA